VKTTVSFEVKLPIPGIAYSNMSTGIVVEGDGDYETTKDFAFSCLEAQIQKLASEMKGVLDNV